MKTTAVKIIFLVFAQSLLLPALPLLARDLYVDPAIGNDTFDGLAAKVTGERTGPVKTIARGIALSRPGDTVNLAPAIYRDKGEQVGFYNKSGEPGKPITLDGHGAVIDGVIRLDPSDWKQVSPGLYKSNVIFSKYVNNQDAMDSIFAFVFNGVINRMGRCQKGAVPGWAYKAPADLQPGEWTYQKADHQALYIKIDPSKTLADYNIDLPNVNSACQISGSVSYLIIKNLTTKHCWNDGFALTTGNAPDSRIHDIVFQNIRAIDMGDDGFSAHGDCDVTVDGFTAIGCGTGFCTGGSGRYNRVLTMDIFGVSLQFYKTGGGKHVITNSLFFCDGHGRPFITVSDKEPGGRVDVTLKNCALIAPPAYDPFLHVEEMSALTCENCTIINQGPTVAKDSPLTLNSCILAGSPGHCMLVPDASNWHGDHNVYDLDRIAVGIPPVSYNAKTFGAYKAATGQDAHSFWQTLSIEQIFNPAKRPSWLPENVGADFSKIPGLPAGQPSLLDYVTEHTKPVVKL